MPGAGGTTQRGTWLQRPFFLEVTLYAFCYKIVEAHSDEDKNFWPACPNTPLQTGLRPPSVPQSALQHVSHVWGCLRNCPFSSPESGLRRVTASVLLVIYIPSTCLLNIWLDGWMTRQVMIRALCTERPSGRVVKSACSTLAVRLWLSFWISQCLSFLIYKLGLEIAPPS